MTTAEYCTVTVQRPNGQIDDVNYTNASYPPVRAMTEKKLVEINKAMKAAGRGQIIGYTNHNKTVKEYRLTASDKAEIISENVRRMAAGGERVS